jgi:hypothetical protein
MSFLLRFGMFVVCLATVVYLILTETNLVKTIRVTKHILAKHLLAKPHPSGLLSSHY